MKRMWAAAVAVTSSVAALAATSGVAGAETLNTAAGAVTVPDGISTGFVVYDRDTGDSTLSYNAHKQFRSASVVKLLIALDYLESHGPDWQIPQHDLEQLQPMLRSSDDTAASWLWVKDGWETIVQRMIAKIGLTDTAPPADRGIWGYTAISAADVVKIYNYILDRADPRYRDFIMSNLRQSTKCGDDGFDQSFGIPSAVPRPWGVKQGWSGFGDGPAAGHECSPANPVPPDPDGADARTLAAMRVGAEAPAGAAATGGPDIDTTRRAMHTTGAVGPHDNKIVVVLTLEPVDTTWETSAARITALTSVLYDISQYL
ncbi:hypothetical protein BCF44_106261 [Kutzneria buriramensis]|uniref:Beta-lactamase family protein n=2 Tax=Kutzneria buriramensis TaxID=1045776 RepID=A0A3E0HLL5_9PSEU|nr:hypothetical protein BCF44_106261 [Kutzneria buriramensis]